MSRTTRLAWSLWTLAVVLLPAGPWLAFHSTDVDMTPFAIAIAIASIQLAAASTGAVVASRLPRNAVGWIFLALGVGIGLGLGSTAWAELGLETRHGPLPGDEVAAWVSSWLPTVVFSLPLFLLLVFPDGRFVSPRWRRAGLAIAGLVAFVTLITAFAPSDLDSGIENPLAPGGAPGAVIEVLDAIATALGLPALAVVVAGLVVRFRRARGIERQQLKWFMYAGAIAGCGLVPLDLLPPGRAADVALVAGLLGLTGVPVAAGIAILRHQLYDIDVVINRTLVYGALTATLAGAYVGSVLLLQLVLSPGSDLAIAGSTLAVAALFRPARAAIQAAVDRRFYRRKYDAARTLERFGARLRDEVDLGSLSAELRGVVADTVQPSHVSLWLRDRNASRTPAA